MGWGLERTPQRKPPGPAPHLFCRRPRTPSVRRSTCVHAVPTNTHTLTSPARVCVVTDPRLPRQVRSAELRWPCCRVSGWLATCSQGAVLTVQRHCCLSRPALACERRTQGRQGEGSQNPVAPLLWLGALPPAAPALTPACPAHKPCTPIRSPAHPGGRLLRLGNIRDITFCFFSHPALSPSIRSWSSQSLPPRLISPATFINLCSLWGLMPHSSLPFLSPFNKIGILLK